MGRTWGHWGTGGNIGAPAPPIIEPRGGKKEGTRGKERGKVARFTLLSVECARLTPAPIMRNDNGRKSVIRNLRLAAIIT